MPAPYELECLLLERLHVAEDNPALITTASFPQFPSLAIELRLAIWRQFALPKKLYLFVILDLIQTDDNRVTKVTYRDPEVSKRCGDVRRIMQVNIEARREVLQGRQLVIWKNIRLGRPNPSFSFVPSWYEQDPGKWEWTLWSVVRIGLIMQDKMRMYPLDPSVPEEKYRDGRNLVINKLKLLKIIGPTHYCDKCESQLIVSREGTEDEGQQIVCYTFPFSQWAQLVVPLAGKKKIRIGSRHEVDQNEVSGDYSATSPFLSSRPAIWVVSGALDCG
ncbi:hypothetical protein EV127DRAFT_411558 [Xylaria flabelliformis]|nr:hypothetical protein EV127DRAFT_411558 [Xylaria flabelliformis]